MVSNGATAKLSTSLRENVIGIGDNVVTLTWQSRLIRTAGTADMFYLCLYANMYGVILSNAAPSQARGMHRLFFWPADIFG